MMMIIPPYHHNFPHFSLVQMVSISQPGYGKTTDFWEQIFLQVLPHFQPVYYRHSAHLKMTPQFVWKWQHCSENLVKHTFYLAALFT